ncbi:MAG: metallophosphoesterase family protein [Candidatus Eremiobacterota bacterium]
METTLVGVISDTHGLLRPEAVQALTGCERILHAGDVEDPAILTALEHIAPVTAVRGNVDDGPLRSLPLTQAVQVAGVSIYMVHRPEDLDLDPEAAGFSVVIFGHTHRPLAEWRGRVLYLNPGSAGPRRFDLPISLARLRIAAGRVEAELVQLPFSPGR